MIGGGKNANVTWLLNFFCCLQVDGLITGAGGGGLLLSGGRGTVYKRTFTA